MRTTVSLELNTDYKSCVYEWLYDTFSRLTEEGFDSKMLTVDVDYCKAGGGQSSMGRRQGQA